VTSGLKRYSKLVVEIEQVRAVHFKKLSSVVPLAFLKKKVEKFLDFNTMFLF